MQVPIQVIGDISVPGGQEFIEIDGRKRHAISYLGSFLFAPDRVRMPVGALSGGEQNRAILARLFSKPANLLVLDEPTNDLDIETLELLEEILLDFDGTVLLVSHDRRFMDNVVTSILVMSGDGTVQDHVGGYGSWVEKGGRLAGLDDAPRGAGQRVKQPKGKPKPAVQSPKPAKLSYMDQRELDSLPGRIEELEEKPKRQVNSYLGTGTWGLRRAFFDYAAFALTRNPPERRSFVDALQLMVHDHHLIQGYDLMGSYVNVNAPADIERAELLVR